MITHTKIKYKIKISFKPFKNILKDINKEKLFMYISGILIIRKSQLYKIRISGNDLFIITHIHPTVSILELINELKTGIKKYLNSYCLFPHFVGTQLGENTFTYKKEKKLVNKEKMKYVFFKKKGYNQLK